MFKCLDIIHSHRYLFSAQNCIYLTQLLNVDETTMPITKCGAGHLVQVGPGHLADTGPRHLVQVYPALVCLVPVAMSEAGVNM